MSPVVLTLIIPCYNVESTLRQCLESILANQSNYSFEVKCVDNNSNDGTKDIIEKFISIDPRVSYLLEKEQGRSQARNCGAAHSHSEFLAFIDADVILESNWIEEMINFAKKYRCKGMQSPIKPMAKSKGLFESFRLKLKEFNTSGDFAITSIVSFEFPMINSAACFYEKIAFDQVGGFDKFLPRHEDIDLSKRIAFNGGKIGINFGTKANVLFHGGGWKDYYIREYLHGYTKRIYLGKWENWSRSSLLNYPKKSRLDHLNKISEEFIGRLGKRILIREFFTKFDFFVLKNYSLRTFILEQIAVLIRILGMIRGAKIGRQNYQFLLPNELKSFEVQYGSILYQIEIHQSQLRIKKC